MATALPWAAGARSDYPSRPIRLILGFPPSGGTNAFARLLAPRMAEALGQPFIVENRIGANGNLATEFVVNAPPDGHTLLLSASSAIVTAPHERRFLVPCFSISHSPGPNSFSPALSTSR